MTVVRHPGMALLILAGCLCGGLPAAAQEAAPAADEIEDGDAIYIVRSYLPQQEVAGKVQGYLPMNRADFEAKLKAIERLTGGRGQRRPNIVRALYWARLEDRQFVEGRGELSVHNPGDSTGTLSLAPSRLPLRQLRWADPDAPSVLSGTDPAGNLIAAIDRSAKLLCSWSLRGETDDSGTLSFDVTLPPSAISRFVVDLPDDVVPRVDRGMVLPVQPGDVLDEEAAVETIPRLRAEDDALRRWLIELGGQHQFVMRLLPGPAEMTRQDQPPLRQTLAYRLTRTGIELQASFTLDVPGTPLDQLVFDADPALRPIAARIGDRELAAEQFTRGAAAGELVLHFDQPLSGTRRTLVVTALAPLHVDRQLRLPRLDPRQVRWEQGTASLEIADALVLKKLVATGCVETGVELLGPPLSGELRQFHAYQPQAALDVVVGYPAQRTQLASGSTIRMNTATMKAQVVVDVAAQQGAFFALDANLVGTWTVDKVESIPAQALDGDPARRARGSNLRLQLRRGAAQDQDVRIVITAHRRMPANRERLDARDFRVVEFRDVGDQRHLVSLHAEAPYHLALAGDPDIGLTATDLAAVELERLDASPGGWVYLDEHPDEAFAVRLTQDEPQYSARIATEAVVDAGYLLQTTRIRCAPASSPVARLLVRFPRPVNGATAWSVDGDEEGVLSARIVPGDAADQAQTWQVALRQPRVKEFELATVSRVAFRADTPIPLASLPEAAAQSGTVMIGASDGTRLTIDDQGLAAIPAVQPSGDKYPRARAVFRYDPSTEAVLHVSPRQPQEWPAPAWAWECRLVSRFEAGGAARHEARFLIQNTGLRRTYLTLEGSLSIDRVLVNETEVAFAQTKGPSHRIMVLLPPEERFPLVRVFYSTRSNPWGQTAVAEAPWPHIDLPCLERRWKVWLPPGHQAAIDPRMVDDARSWSTAWDQRLFGRPLVRRGGKPFDLFAAASWRGLVRRPDTGQARQAADAFRAVVERVLQDAALDAAAPAPRWSDVAFAYGSTAAAARLLVDRTALAAAGIGPSTPVVPATSHRPPQLATILARQNLAVVAQADAVLLTTVDRLREWARELMTTPHAQLFVTGTPGLVQRLRAGRPAGAICSAGQWLASSAAGSPPWTPLAARGDGDEYAVGWESYDLLVDEQPQASLRVYQPAALRLVGWSCLLLTAGLLVWVLRNRAAAILLVATAAAVAVLLVPLDYLPLARGVLLGALAALACAVVRRPKPAVDDSAVTWSGSGSSARQVAGTVTALLLVCLAAGGLRAQEEAAAPARAAKTFAVIIPVDDERQAVGDFLHVPEPLWKALHRRAALADAAPQEWLLRSAVYDATLGTRDEGARLYVSELIVSYEFETFGMDRRVRLPLARSGLRFPTAARLDGQPLDLQWDDEGQALVFDVARSGRHQLDVWVLPALRNDATSSGFELSVPPISAARLKVACPPAVGTIELPTAIGAIDRDAATGVVTADLGPTDRLAVRWPRAVPEPAGQAHVHVRPLYWLRLQPSSVVLEAQFTFLVRSGVIDQVTLRADPRLELSPQFDQENPVSGHTVETGAVRTIHVALDDAYDDRVTLRTAFLVTDTSGIGNLELPRLEAVAETADPAWLGISVAPNLVAEVVPGEPRQPLAAADFLAAWEAADQPPQLAFKLLPDQGPWHLAVRPKQPRSEVQQQLDYSVAQNRVEVTYQADVTTSDGHHFEHRLAIPRGLRVERVTVLQDEAPRSLQWASSEGELSVFLDAPISGAYQLQLAGRVAVSPGRRVELPAIRFVDGTTTSSRLGLYRRADVVLHEIQTRGLTALEELTTLGALDPLLGRLAGAYRENGPQQPAVITVTTRPNRPRIRGRLIHYLYPRGTQWFVEAALSLRIEAGVVDQLRLTIPDSWTEPPEIEPPMPYDIQPHRTSRVLVLRPDRAVRNRLELRIRQPLASAPSRHGEAPLVALREVDVVNRFLVLPDRQDDRPVAWQTSGLRPVALADEPGAPLLADASTAYRVVEPRAVAALENVAQVAASPQILLADIHVAFDHDRSCRGVASFDLQPAGRADCELVMPRGIAPVHIAVAGLPATAVPRGDDRWRVRLGPNHLPQRIEVVFAGRLAAGPRALGETVLAPLVADLPVRYTLWTVRGPAAETFRDALLQHSLTDRVQQDQLRAAAAEQALQLGAPLLPPNPTDEFDAWRAVWQQRRRQAQQRAAAGSPDEYAAAGLPLGEAVAVWQRQSGPPGETVRFALKGSSGQMHLRYVEHGRRGVLARNLGALGLLALAALVLLLVRLPRARELVLQWPHLMGVAAGLVWWLWLTPSAVGLAIMLAFAAGATWPAWQLRRAR